MPTRRKFFSLTIAVSLAAALCLVSSGLQGQGFTALNHTFDVNGPGATVCTDGAIFDGETTGADSLNVLMTSQVFDSTGTTLGGTGDTNTFTAVGQVYTFTVMYPVGTYSVGDTVVLSVTDNPPTVQGAEGDAATATVADCTLVTVPALPPAAYALLALLLVAAGAALARRGALGRGSRPGPLGFVLLAALIATGAAATEPSTPGFSKAFMPDTIGPGSTSMLIFTINNIESVYPVGMLAFDDEFPFGMELASPGFVSNTCGGTVALDDDDADSGFDVRLTDGMVGADDSCEIVVNVIGTTDCGGVAPEGASIAVECANVSGDLTSEAGNSGSASDSLFVDHTLPGFTKSFAPNPVEFGAKSTLTFLIDNKLNPSPVPNLDFTDTLPPGMVVASPSNKATTCGTSLIPPTLTAPPGGSTITLDANGTAGFPAVAAGSFCTVTVDVVGGAVGALGNVSGNLLADSVEAGKATAELEVTGFNTLLQILKEFTDDPVQPGGTVTLEFEITNKSRDFPATAITFDDVIDPMGGLTGLTPILPPTPDPPCGAGSTLTFSSGTLTLSGGTLPAEGMCTFTVDLAVPAGATPGSYANTTTAISGLIDGSPETGNVAGDILSVVAFPLLTKTFTDDPVGTGSAVTLEFTITNTNSSAITDIAFIDELTDGGPDTGFLPFPVSVTLPPTPDPPCGGGSSLALVFVDTDRQGLELTGGDLGAAGSMSDSCTFSVTVDIPAGLAPGTYMNTTEPITAKAGMTNLTGKRAKDTVVIVGAPQISKEFTDDPVLPGGTVTLKFTLENTDLDNAASAIAFTDDLGATLTGLTVTSVDTDTCGGTPGGVGTDMFGYTGGTLAASDGSPGGSDECTIVLTLTTPGSPPGGTFPNTTSEVTATVLGLTAVSPAASDDLVIAGLQFTKEFTGDPVIRGGTATLTFTIDNTAGAPGSGDATSLFFTDDLDAALPGLVATLPPSPDPPCGIGSDLLGFPVGSGGTLLFLIGGSVPGGSSCSFSVTVTVPPTIPGPIPTPDDFYPNTTSSLSTSIGTLPPATDDLEVNSTLLQITKEFTDDPVAAGDSVTLKFTLTNLSATETVTDIAFSDDLDAALTGLEATGAVNDCGGMSPTVFPSGFFEFAGGSLAPGASCMVTLTVDVPSAPLADAPPFINTTSDVTGKVGMLDVGGDPDSDELLVQQLFFEKEFTDDPTTATGTVTLEFTITNLGATPVFDIAFTDDLSTVIAGLEATTLPPVGVCGAGSELSGTSFLSFTGGSLGPSSACTISVILTLPESASAGVFVNTTSELRLAGGAVTDPASDMLTVEPPPTFAKGFSPDVIPGGGTSTLTFTIDNSASAAAVTGMAFTDLVPAGLEVAAVPAVTNSCGGTVTAIARSTSISLASGTLGAGATCTLSVAVQATASGVFVNTSGDLTSSSGNSGTATDTLTVLLPPTFDKAFTPDLIPEGGTSSLTFTIDNSASAAAVTGVAFTDPLPAGLEVAAPSAVTNTCGGTVTAIAGSTSISLATGTLGAGATCTLSVDVQATASGDLVNTTQDLTSSSGNSGTATDTLTVLLPPTFDKTFSPNPTGEGSTTTLTFTIDNTGSDTALTDLDFLDLLPIGLEVATPPALTNTCFGSAVATAGSVSISLSNGTLAAAASCTLSVDIQANDPGDLVNETSDLTSSSGNSGTASDTLTVLPCLAADGQNLTLGGDLVLGMETYEVCDTIEINQHYLVLGPSAVLLLRAGVAVVLFDGVEFGLGSEVTIEIDPSLIP